MRSTGTSRSGTRGQRTRSSRSSRPSRSTDGPRPRSGATFSTSTGPRDHRVTHAGRPPAWWLLATPRDHAAQDRRRSLGAAGRRGRRTVGAPLLGEDDAVVLDVIDEFCPWNAGHWRLARPGQRTTSGAQLRLDVSALGSAYLGAFSRSPASCEAAERRSWRDAAARTRCSPPSALRGAPNLLSP